MGKTKRNIIIVSIVLLSILYISGVIYFSEYSYPKTSVNGKDKGLMSKDQVFVYDDKQYKLTVKGRDNKNIEITKEDVGLETTVVGKPRLNQKVWMWPVEVFQKHNYEVELKNNFNKSLLKEKLKNSKLFTDIIDPQDAKIVNKENKYIIEPEVLGNKLDEDKVFKVVSQSISKFEKELVLDKEYKNPEIKSDNKTLVQKLEKINKIADKSYIFDFEDRKWELKNDELLEMFEETEKGYIPIRDKLLDYVADIAIETDTYNTPREFESTGAGTVTVPGGIYGWQMNVHDTVDNLIAMFNEYKSGEVEIEYNMEAKSRKTNDIGDTYVEIDLSRQHMWFYKNGELFLDTPIISGDARSYKATTPTGVNKIWSKETEVKLKGNNAISGASYTYPVDYWMPIGWTGSGIHDTYHRTEYGGDVYKHNGSSSCINTPPGKMKELFANVPLNTAVVVYESSTNLSPTEFEKQAMIRNGEAEADVQ